MPHISSLRFWGKTNDRGGWHPLPYHCLDVAAVVDALLRADRRLAALVDRLSPLPPDVTRKLLLFFAAVHDVGKFAATFQHKVPELATANGVPRGRGRDDDHTWLGFQFWSGWAYEAQDVVPFDERALDALTPLAICAFAHHGEPVERVLEGTVRPAFGDGWDVAVEHVASCAALFLDGAALPDLEQTGLAPLSWLAAGLFIVADWLGSNERWFPHAVPGPQGPLPSDTEADLRAWFAQACTRADTAIAECGLLPPAPLAAPAFSVLFPALAAHAPHPMQQEALRTDLGEGPQLFIIEDLTGGGKTEAALLLAARLLAAGRGGGVFVGLPTQATANAMYGRLAECVGRLFPDAAASLLLAHGGRALRDDFLASITTGGHAHRRDDTDGRAVCTPWLADSRKKALLAPCGVGTVDQALLGVLPSRHQALRLLGLARSVFISDEVHAFDEYTGKLLQELLRFQAALGGSAILLSATLPRRLRDAFVAAYQHGLKLGTGQHDDADDAAWGAWPGMGPREGDDEADEAESVAHAPFPLLVRVGAEAGADGVHETAVPPSARRLDVQVTLHDNVAPLLDALQQVHRAGGCGAWVRNTVDDAREARRLLVEECGLPAEDVLLFHARFAGCDRQRIEARVLELFGKDSTPEMRRGKILVASQVIEQSIDVDFDILCSDLAPMDLMIQRAGRCQRHGGRPRPTGYESARMLVFAPDPVEDAGATWYATLFPLARHVYPDVPTLWRTARLLREEGGLHLPEQARALVEGAYAGKVPPGVEQAGVAAEAEAMSRRQMGEYNVLRFPTGYERTATSNKWDADVRTPTRLGETTACVRLLRVEGGRVRLWADGEGEEDAAHGAAQPPSMARCLRSEVKVAAWRVAAAVCPPELEPVVRELAECMPDKGKWAVLLPLQLDGAGGWVGEVVGGDDKRQEARYTPGEGLFFTKKGR